MSLKLKIAAESCRRRLDYVSTPGNILYLLTLLLLLTTHSAIGRIRSERMKNISKLRNGDEDFDRLARDILCSAMSPSSVSPRGLSSSSSSSMLKTSEMKPINTSNHSEFDPIENQMDSKHSNEEDDLLFLDVNDHDLFQQLMEQIGDELKSEYYSNINNNELLQYEDDEENENINWSNADDELDHGRSLICPVCRYIRRLLILLLLLFFLQTKKIEITPSSFGLFGFQ